MMQKECLKSDVSPISKVFIDSRGWPDRYQVGKG